MKIKKSLLSITIIATINNLSANNPSNMGEVTVISASGYEQKLVKAPASISVITQEQLHKNSYTNLLDAMRDIEGVDIGETRDKSGQGTISIRGMGGDYTLILIDGKKQNNNGDIYPNNFGGFQYVNIPPLEAIERIEIIRGPMSTLYGADAMGGVINIITKKTFTKWRGSFTQGQTFQTDNQFGNNKTSDFAIRGPIIKDKLGLSLRGSYYDKEASNPQTSSGTTFGGAGKTVDNQNWTLGASLTFTPSDKHILRFDYDIMKQKYDNTSSNVGTVDSKENLWFKRRGNFSPRVGYAPIQRMQREQYSILHEGFWEIGKSTIGIHHIKTSNNGRSLPLNPSERLFMNDLYANYSSLNDFETNGSSTQLAQFNSLLPRPKRVLESKNITYNGKIEIPFEKHFLVLGTQYIDAQLEDGVFGITNKTKKAVTSSYKQWALFLEDSWDILKDLTFTTGIRYDDHETFGSHLSPRAYLVYNANSNLIFKGGVATGYKTPKTTDLFSGITGFGGQGTLPWVGNPNLKPEESLNTEIAAYYQHNAGHDFNITLFKNNFNNKIESVNVQQNQLPSQWNTIASSMRQKQNIGNAQIKGIELSGKYKILDNLTIKANYTYTDSKRDDNKNPLSSTAKHLYSATLNWQTTSKWNNFLRIVGEKDRWRGDDKLKYYDNYQVFDLGTSYKISKDVIFNARINNLLDKDFTKMTSYKNDNGDTVETYAYNLAQKRRELWLSLNIKF
ncbi:TonB-dependent receptor [Malaciobacter mytili LMG 24559]|uniref:TonB-dependent receptor n=1 Tax=Malaciobacter mytili LMG 24559 TaxID=1032238 RepID=A0AAX2ALT3_9BACT|nr:TonB-dependent receptor [Malaciobacter mytili]AXH14114.1 TonB-dependent receptor [Malaciobacter mytili LMG 24559]RXK16991.1 TonB-dependent receptor [Malaciobacter mytili LMG 24559]